MDKLTYDLKKLLEDNRNLIEKICRKFNSRGTDLKSIPEYIEAENKHEERYENYLKKLRKGRETKRPEIKMMNERKSIFDKMSKSLPSPEDFVQEIELYNEELEVLYPLTT